jgi:hypothetical protein
MPTEHIIALLVAERDKLNRPACLASPVWLQAGGPEKAPETYGQALQCLQTNRSCCLITFLSALRTIYDTGRYFWDWGADTAW